MSKQYTVALNCYIANALPVKYQITAHRLWHVAKQGRSLYCLQKCFTAQRKLSYLQRRVMEGTIQWSHLFHHSVVWIPDPSGCVRKGLGGHEGSGVGEVRLLALLYIQQLQLLIQNVDTTSTIGVHAPGVFWLLFISIIFHLSFHSCQSHTKILMSACSLWLLH